jgi:malonate-semialdehyde dehydrogenase (acetylating)/methylmalonate-semialdehyde dehydrogenase
MNTIASNQVPTVKLLINGEFVESKTTEWRYIVNPATQEVLARVPFATANEVNEAIQSAHTAFKTWKDTPVGARMRIMLKFQALIR